MRERTKPSRPAFRRLLAGPKRAQPAAVLRWGDKARGHWLVFEEPRAVLEALTPEDVSPLLERLDAEAKNGAFCVGFVSYEAAPAASQIRLLNSVRGWMQATLEPSGGS